MKFHIVRNRETIDDILFLYELEKDELIEVNKHIRAWDKLIPGTKLKIPTITKQIDQEVTSMEPFIEDYYPRSTENNFEETSEENESVELAESIEQVTKVDPSEQKETEEIKDEPCGQERKATVRNRRYYRGWYYYVPVYYPVYNIKKRH